jgi:hypothetical protein
MPPRTDAKHLTEAKLAERWGMTPQAVAAKRKKGDDMPPHLPITGSATKQTIRYRLADVEAWEESHLVFPASA